LFDVASHSYVSGAAITTSSTAPTTLTSSAVTFSVGSRYYEFHMDLPPVPGQEVQNDDDAGVLSFLAIRKD
jgi:hypothetical protein